MDNTEVAHLTHRKRHAALGAGKVATPPPLTVVTAQAIFLSGKPNVALLILHNVGRERSGGLHAAETTLGQIGLEHAIDGTHPQPATTVAIERIDAGGSTHNCRHRSREGVHAQDALSVGAYQQIVALKQEGMGIDLRQSASGGEIDHLTRGGIVTIDTAIVGGHPNAMLVVFAEARHNVAPQQRRRL